MNELASGIFSFLATLTSSRTYAETRNHSPTASRCPIASPDLNVRVCRLFGLSEGQHSTRFPLAGDRVSPPPVRDGPARAKAAPAPPAPEVTAPPRPSAPRTPAPAGSRS